MADLSYYRATLEALFYRAQAEGLADLAWFIAMAVAAVDNPPIVAEPLRRRGAKTAIPG